MWLMPLCMLLVTTASAQTPDATEEEAPGVPGMSADEVARMLDNPLGNLWIIFMENDLYRYRGDPSRGSDWVNATLFQPVLPIALTDDWNLITRPILPLMSAPKFEVDPRFFGDCPGNCNTRPPASALGGLFGLPASREVAWGDLIVWSMVSPAEAPKLPDGSTFVWGLGPTFRFPTATDNSFGSQRYSTGPAAIGLRLPKEDGRWTLGLFQQHFLWSFGGDSDRARVKQSQFQYIWWYKLPTEKAISVGAFPMIDVNWEADPADRWLIPVGLGASYTFFLGPAPMRVGLEFDWYVRTSKNYGPRFVLKFFFVPVIPRMIKEPIFNRFSR
jgi:hypothetical protein